MKAFIIDLSGKVINYDLSLYHAIDMSDGSVDVKLLIPDSKNDVDGVIHLLSLVPSKYKYTEQPLKRIVKAIEGVVNYTYILLLCITQKPEVLHFQWFPFMDFCSVDFFYIYLIKKLRRKQRVIFTVHNVYPHGISSQGKRIYKKRFMRMRKFIDFYISHTNSSKEELVNEYALNPNKVFIIPHGIFTPDYKKCNYKNVGGYNVIMYGNNLPYKGSDVLLDAVQLLPADKKNKITVTIVGATPNEYLDLLRSKTVGLNVNIIPLFVPDKQLYELIDKSNYIALPYRRITQSGVLLLALYFRKPLLISNLPPFVETLKGFTEDMFFISGDPNSLKELIIRHMEGKVDIEKQMSIIEGLNDLYSWNNSAKMTIETYRKVI